MKFSLMINYLPLFQKPTNILTPAFLLFRFFHLDCLCYCEFFFLLPYTRLLFCVPPAGTGEALPLQPRETGFSTKLFWPNGRGGWIRQYTYLCGIPLVCSGRSQNFCIERPMCGYTSLKR
jgi:hypothetical protein